MTKEGVAMGSYGFARLQRGLRKPPRVLLRRLLQECKIQAGRFLEAGRARRFTVRSLLRTTGASSLEELWLQLLQRPYPACTSVPNSAAYDELCPEDRGRILLAAEAALDRRIDLLGTGPVKLGTPIDWHCDFKTYLSWPLDYSLCLDYANLDRPSDVKVPWELSRGQWLLPLGQAYLLTGAERYATAARDVLAEWIEANPFARGINWACTMEVALRILSWTWLFHAFGRSQAWAEPDFRGEFLRTLFLHGDFTERHLECGDVNGNHYTADAAGLVFAGTFFGPRPTAQRWQDLGWTILEQELPRQVFSDGVDFEASTAYHRLVLELFLFPALYRQAHGLEVHPAYRERVVQMARFTRAYSRPDGSTPLWGDADDARALPLGGQGVNDHRYLLGLVGAAWQVPDLKAAFSGSRSEVFWWLGADACADLPARAAITDNEVGSQAFSQGGFFVMRNDQDHVFIDCGPVGLAGRGGHGHNDCLAFEAVLAGCRLISDCGAFVYTASPDDRNRFRATAAHNTPRVNQAEINRFRERLDLWHLRNDAHPQLRQWRPGPTRDRFQGGHTGYQRLPQPVTPVRTIVLDHRRHALVVGDRFESQEPQHVDLEIPLHLAVGVTAVRQTGNTVVLESGSKRFHLAWEGAGPWRLEIGTGRISPRYGVAVDCQRLAWYYAGPVATNLLLWVAPDDSVQEISWHWIREVLEAGVGAGSAE
jgi:uncharacterized heparinase superfamily protein